jgi:ubiquinone biosynthesis protein Coq4
MEAQPQATSPAAAQSPHFPSLNVDAFLRFAANPQDTNAILGVQKTLVQAPNRNEMIKKTYEIVSTTPEFVALFNEKYIPPFPTNEELMAYPDGTLGRATGEHLTKNGIQLDFAGLDVEVFYSMEMNLIGYMNVRGIRTHDIYHAVLGLGVTPIDEYALASFTLAQYASPYHMLLVSSGYMNTAFEAPSLIPKFLEQTHKFFELGKKAKPFIGFKYEENWATPLTEVREMLGVAEAFAPLN